MDKLLSWKERWEAALRQQHQELFDHQLQGLKPEYAEHISCPVCDSPDSEFLFEKDWFRQVRCCQCSMVYMNPRMNQKATHSFYNSNVNAIYNETKFDQASGSTEMDDRINLGNLRLIDDFKKGKKGTLLEIGSAKGYFLAQARESGYNIYGLELNQPNYEFSRKQLGDTILDVDLSDAHFENEKFDVVYMRDVIEHIPDPGIFLQEVGRVTKPDGILFIETHNIEGWIHKIAKERHVVIFGFEHPNHWSPQTLEKALEQRGFVVQKVLQASLDFTLQSILEYMIIPSFTTIYPKPVNPLIKLLVNVLRAPFYFKVVRWLDRNTLPHLADFFGRGSVMKVIARKVSL